MRHSRTNVALLIAAILAVLLIAYVFTGSKRVHADNSPHCASSQALGQVKSELFRRAAQLRQADEAAIANVARYSVVRAPSRMVRQHHAGSATVTCTGSIVLDLPPGIAAAGERRSLAANAAYDLAPGREGLVRMLRLGAVDAITAPLATLFQTSQAAQPLPNVQPVDQTDESLAPGSDGQSLAPPPVVTRPARKPQPPAPRPGPSPPQSEQAERSSPEPAPAPPPRAAPAPPKAPAQAQAPAPAPAPAEASARPSFNCRYAHTSGEKAVCGSAGLASLDRQMAGQYYRALSVARPGQRTMLERSRKRFLRFRDSCASQACIADAYRGRMREISDIIDGGY